MRRLGPAADRVRAGRPLGEADDVAGPQRPLALRRPQHRVAAEDEHPLLVRVLVVVRADRLARRQLVDRRAQLRGAERRPEARRAGAEARRVVVVRALERDVVDVDVGHGPILTTMWRAGKLVAVAALVLAGTAAAAPPKAGVLVPGRSLGGVSLGDDAGAGARRVGLPLRRLPRLPGSDDVVLQPRALPAAGGGRGAPRRPRRRRLHALEAARAGARATASRSASRRPGSRRSTARSRASSAAATRR